MQVPRTQLFQNTRIGERFEAFLKNRWVGPYIRIPQVRTTEKSPQFNAVDLRSGALVTIGNGRMVQVPG